jgi:hypothetical protein
VIRTTSVAIALQAILISQIKDVKVGNIEKESLIDYTVLCFQLATVVH